MDGSFGAACPGTALAQSALWSPSPAVTLPSAVEAYQTNRTAAMQVFTPTDLAPAIASTTQPFQWGSITVHPHLDYEFLYGTGIQSSPGRQLDSIWQKVSPGTTINLGDHWLVDYTPTLNYYSATDLKDTVNHAARVSGGTACGDWFLQVSQAFTDYSDPDVETASQSDRQNFTTTVNANDQINSKLSLALSVSQVVNDITRSGYSINQLQNLSDSRTWSTTDWLNYEFNPRLTAGVGAGAGFISENIGYDIVFEQAQGQIHWRATDKISFQISGGMQEQQYLHSGQDGQLNPIYNGTIQYQPFEQTRLSLTASQTVANSAYANQMTVSSDLTANLNQRLLGKLYLDLGGGYHHSEYDATMIGLSSYRTDDTYTFNTRLSHPFLKRGTFALVYLHRQNASSQSGFAVGSSAYGYSSNQVGFDISFRY